MKTKNIYILIVALLLGLTSCDDFIDTTPKNSISNKIVWTEEASVTLYVNTFYAYLDRYGNFGSEQFSGNLTEGMTETLKYGSYVPGSRAGDSNTYVFTPETISSTGNLLNIWKSAYERIRRINEFLVGLKQHSKLGEATNQKFEAQARFFRAFLYFQLAKRHGGVILYTDMNLVKDKNRDSAAATWALIAEDLDFAAEHSPAKWSATDSGRITKGACYALKSRAMLYAERWQDAVDAADKVLALNEYALVAEYENSWVGKNSESILECNYLETGPSHNFDIGYIPYGEVENTGGSAAPTQEMVESYEKTDGTKVDWAPWHVKGGTTTRPPYDQLEPRFHATILYNGAKWKGKIMENSVEGTNGRYMGYREDTYTKGRTTTGYYLRKLMDETLLDAKNKKSSQTWVEIRLAEVYLNRAEAYYRLNSSGKSLNDLNEVRVRVGLPKKEGLSGENLFSAIRQERKIELAYEGHLYWDMRRWKLADKEYNGYRVHGFKITPRGTDWLFEYVDCDLQDRKFLKKTYVLPVPYSELSSNSAIEQYDEWK